MNPSIMKPMIKTALIILIIGLILISCKKESDNNTQLTIDGQLINHSECKSGLKSAAQTLEIPDSLSCVEYFFDNETNKLTLKHINAGFNCCPDSLYCIIELKEDTIQIQEFEKTTGCHCDCLYDLNIEIDGVIKNVYKIQFLEPYVAEQAILLFEIDLNECSQGSYCVTRKIYPWGVSSLIDLDYMHYQ